MSLTQLPRSLLAAPHREGGQAQFIRTPIPAVGDHTTAATREWALQRLGQHLSAAHLAQHANTSTRTLTRRFVMETGFPSAPMALARPDRLARDLVEDSDATVEVIAHQTGLDTASNLRLHFTRLTTTTPTAYRNSFSGQRAPTPKQ